MHKGPPCPVLARLAGGGEGILLELGEQLVRGDLAGAGPAARPGPVLDEDACIKIAEIRSAQMALAAQARPVPLAALPSNYRHLSPAEQAEADMNRRRAAHATQQAAIDAATPEVVQGEIIDD